MYLLDANVLIALGDTNHVHHSRAHQWFHAQPGRPWATCPLTENAFLRIVGASSYPSSPGDPEVVRTLLNLMCSFPGHQFWPDSVTLKDSKVFRRLPISKHLTDVYLLALAVSRQAKFATLDIRIDPKLVSEGTKAYFVIP